METKGKRKNTIRDWNLYSMEGSRAKGGERQRKHGGQWIIVAETLKNY